jgi:hypothetical protein
VRILRLDVQGWRFEFHPYVSVLPTLTADHKASVLDAIRGLPAGSVLAASGLIEAHGVLLDLDTANLALLDLLPTDGDAGSIDVVVRPDQVPGAGPPPAAREHAELMSRRNALLDELRDAEAATEGEEHQRAREALAASRAGLIRAQKTRADAAAALESARGDRDPSAAGALDAARQRIAELEQELSLGAVDRYPVEEALAHIEDEGHGSEQVPSDEAHKIADQWVSVTARLSGDQPMTGVDPDALQAARRRLADARAAVFEAERAMRLRDVRPEDAEALERVHEEVVAAQRRLTRRFSGSRALERRDAAREEEQAILDRVGFRTYTDFVLGSTTLDDDPVKQRAHDEAHIELARAEDDLTSLEALIDAELVRAELRNQQKVLRSRAIELLGEDPGEDVERALRQLRVDPRAGDGRVAAHMSAADLAARIEAARSTLVEAERRVEHDAEAERQVGIARTDLEQASAIEERAATEVAHREQALVNAADDDLVRVRAELAAVDAELAALGPIEIASPPDANPEELEWYLLSRLAAQRSVSFAGSVPIVLDDALDGQPADSIEHLLESLERMAVAVQIIVLTDDPQVALWADRVGPDRAAIVEAELIS